MFIQCVRSSSGVFLVCCTYQNATTAAPHGHGVGKDVSRAVMYHVVADKLGGCTCPCAYVAELWHTAAINLPGNSVPEPMTATW